MFQPQNEAANEYIFICCFSFLKRSYQWWLPWQQGRHTQHHWFKQLIKDRCLKRASKQPSAFPSMSYFSTNKNIPQARKSSWILKVKTWFFSQCIFLYFNYRFPASLNNGAETFATAIWKHQRKVFSWKILLK